MVFLYLSTERSLVSLLGQALYLRLLGNLRKQTRSKE